MSEFDAEHQPYNTLSFITLQVGAKGDVSILAHPATIWLSEFGMLHICEQQQSGSCLHFIYPKFIASSFKKYYYVFKEWSWSLMKKLPNRRTP